MNQYKQITHVVKSRYEKPQIQIHRSFLFAPRAETALNFLLACIQRDGTATDGSDVEACFDLADKFFEMAEARNEVTDISAQVNEMINPKDEEHDTQSER